MGETSKVYVLKGRVVSGEIDKRSELAGQPQEMMCTGRPPPNVREACGSSGHSEECHAGQKQPGITSA